jgi:hypothetical protein
VLLPWHADLGLAAALAGTVLAGQCAWVLWNLLERRFALPERGTALVATGLGGLMATHTALAVAGLAGLPDPQSLLTDPMVLIPGVLFALASWLVATVGFVLLHSHQGRRRSQVLAALDETTGIATRRSIIAALDRDVARAIRTRLPMAVLMLEPDLLGEDTGGARRTANPCCAPWWSWCRTASARRTSWAATAPASCCWCCPTPAPRRRTPGRATVRRRARPAPTAWRYPRADAERGRVRRAAGAGRQLGPAHPRGRPGLEQARQYGGNRVHTTATLGRMAHAGMMTSSHATFPTSLH